MTPDLVKKSPIADLQARRGKFPVPSGVLQGALNHL